MSGISSSTILRAAVSVAEMARMVNLSRARFYQLQREGVFPWPCYSIETRRPLYTEEQQAAVLNARRRNLGVNGQPVLFYASRSGTARAAPRRSQASAARSIGPAVNHPILEAVKGLGMASATIRDVDAAVTALYPAGAATAGSGEVIRAVFLHLRRQSSGDNVQR